MPSLPAGSTCPLKWLRGLEATYTERGSTATEKPANRSKSGARNLIDLQLRELLKTTIVREEATSTRETSALGP
jgi:hypothetical protein